MPHNFFLYINRLNHFDFIGQNRNLPRNSTADIYLGGLLMDRFMSLLLTG